jgi:hypothetical protein
MMSVDFTAFDAQVTGTDGTAGSASGNLDGGDGGNAIDALPPYSNTDFSLEPSLNRVFPTTIGGNGGAGAGGANATTTSLAVQGGRGGKGGAAFVTMANDIFGSASNHYAGSITITVTANGLPGGLAGGAGGAGGRGGLGITVTVGTNGSNDSIGTDGAGGGAGGIGEVANADVTKAISYATSDLSIQLIATGGQGGQGGFGGSGGNGSLSAGNGGNGAAGGSGAPAEATFSGATAFNDSAIFVTEKVTGGLGGSGGVGGNGGNVGPVGSPPTGFGSNGNGADGGQGGGASATVSGDTVTAPSVQFTLAANGGLGGAGGLGGNAGSSLGQAGVAGVDGAGSITFTNNVVTVGSGIPGDTLTGANDLLLLNLRVATTGPAGFFPGTLDGSAGGNLAFSGNTFIGDGISRLVLQLGSTGTATVDTASNTMSIDGSPTNNTISGFTTFALDTNDTFIAGGGAYKVTFAPDPDTLVFTPNSGNVALSGLTSTNFLLDFRGFSPSFDAAALAGDTDTSTGSTVITLSPSSAITLEGYTGGIAPGNVLFEAACYLKGTRIATPEGEVAVEHLREGVMVCTASGAIRRIAWIGFGKALATRGRRTAATPVIVRRSALGPNVPHRDLRVTKGHSFYLDGVLIPVEFLVNHRSIAWDDRAQEVTVFHIELDTHDVLLANGAPAESYRDDGNRWLFQNANTGWHLPPKPPCAPVLTGGPIVDAAWRRLLALAGPRPGLPLTEDPDLHLRADGVRTDAARREGDAVVFALRSVPSTLRLVSRAAAPQELGLARDPRVLGVAVRAIEARQGRHLRALGAADPLLADGFHCYESAEDLRWTDGDAQIPGALFDGLTGPIELTLRLAGKTAYIEEGTAVRAA